MYQKTILFLVLARTVHYSPKSGTISAIYDSKFEVGGLSRSYVHALAYDRINGIEAFVTPIFVFGGSQPVLISE